MFRVIDCVTQHHDPPIVLLAVLICAIACFTAATMLTNANGGDARARRVWLAGAGVAFGAGVWATHFVAMLAFDPGLPMQFRLEPTLLSALLAMAGATMAFALRRLLPARSGDAVAAVALCGAVGGMHYLGTSAIQMPALLLFDPDFVLASLVGGVLAIFVAFRLLDGRLMDGTPTAGARLHAAFWLALGICVVHFTGMAGTSFIPLVVPERTGAAIAPGLLAISVASVSALLLLSSLAASLIDAQFVSRAAREARRLRQLVNATSEGIIISACDVALDLNDAACAILGRPAEQLIGRNFQLFLPLAEQEMLRQRRGAPIQTPMALHALLPDGERRPIEMTSRPIEHDGGPATVFAIRDLTAAMRDQAHIEYLAHHDALTDLPNRLLFNDRLEQALEQAARQQASLAVLCVDLDRFKQVNDLLGHQAGDQLLAQAAERMRATCRGMDTVARVGGDEFALLQPGANAVAAAALARRLVGAMAETFDLDDHTVEIGMSIGIAMFPDDGTAAARLLMNADTALYRAKRDGRGVFRFFEVGMDGQAQERRALEQALRHAIAQDGLDVHYQPFFDMESGEAVGCEALLRWNHPTRGAIPPSEFIPIAETSGLIVALGNWVLRIACAEAASWPAHLVVAVNLSPVQFRQPDIPAVVADTLRVTGLPAHRLELEVTEGVLIDAPDRARALLVGLKKQGVRIALDDFGTGYSNLSYLRRLPFDKLKIDRSFIGDIGRSEDADAILHAIVMLAHSLRLTVIAEGVETPAQLHALRAQRCDQMQGYLLARPMPAAELPWVQAAENESMQAAC